MFNNIMKIKASALPYSCGLDGLMKIPQKILLSYVPKEYFSFSFALYKIAPFYFILHKVQILVPHKTQTFQLNFFF